MIPILSAEQIRQADAHTIAHEPISSLDLMERAATACAERLMATPNRGEPVVVLAGMGNNGGDGLVVARVLRAKAQREVRVLVLKYKETGSPDFETNLERTRQAGVPVELLREGDLLPDFGPEALVVDAIFGTGLQKPVAGWPKEIIRELNGRPNRVVAIDLPSGLFADDNEGNDPDAIVRADRTLTLELPKRALLMADHFRYAGTWEVVPIGLDRGFIAKQPTDTVIMESGDLAPLLPRRTRVAHKGNHGHAWLLAGGPGKMGAALLAAKGCLRSGCGLLTVHVPQGQDGVVHTALPEAMLSLDESRELSALPKFGRVDAIGVGPGMGTSEASARLLKHLVQEAPAPLVIDADALSILAENRTWLAFLPAGTILTPHPKELERLAGKATSDGQRLEQARELARKHRLVVVLKGAYTAVCSPDGRVFFNTDGNAGMAKGGSGDVLTGILVALRAQGMEPLSCALLGVKAHAMAGDRAAAAMGMDGMLPSDQVAQLPAVWLQLRAMQEA
ncbi:MAG TPA: NAD(P)H-hydrate dehydratase [Flavobacteriales bacterium]|nr:NAD(P)H-hydrate dehydratase [Flavobacteriales bacterium]